MMVNLSTKDLLHYLLELFMKENGEVIREKATADKNGQMVHAMKVIGKETRLTALVSYFMQTATFTRENGEMTKPMAKAPTPMLTEQDIKEIGKMISNMDSALKHGLMEPFMKDNIARARKMEKAS
jgi:hypothetical protein